MYVTDDPAVYGSKPQKPHGPLCCQVASFNKYLGFRNGVKICPEELLKISYKEWSKYYQVEFVKRYVQPVHSVVLDVHFHFGVQLGGWVEVEGSKSIFKDCLCLRGLNGD